MRFYGDFKVANQKGRKAIDNVHVILIKIHLSLLCLRQGYGVFPVIYSQLLTILGSCYCKKQIYWRQFFVLLLMINFIITLSKLTAKPLSYG